ncbi:hypothetical protein AAG663_08730 [Bacillus licheniformis]|uniref:hypothetical protein n=1 Tax=Bacillus licheniformis TaxID=1402 RepID=UPI0018A06D4D|nr:hypothetical protein [Bacillus licheniformis]
MLKNIELKGMDDLETKKPTFNLVNLHLYQYFFSYFLFDWKITIGFFIAGVLMGGLCLAENFLKE